MAVLRKRGGSYKLQARHFALLFLLATLFFQVPEALVEDTLSQGASCIRYRSKRDAVPIYQRAETTSKVIGRLGLGERVCYVGERANFTIIDWRGKSDGHEEHPDVAFVRTVELWSPNRPKDFTGTVKDWYQYWRSGGTPDDSFFVFRPFLGCSAEPECKAGKICERIERDRRKEEVKE